MATPIEMSVLQLKQSIAKLLMESEVQYLSNVITWLDNIVCQLKATNNITFNSENYEEGFTFPGNFLTLVGTTSPLLILKAIPWIEMKVCEARVLGTVTLDDENGLIDPIWVEKWLQFNEMPMEPNSDRQWTNLVLAVTSILVDAEDDLQEVIEWFERKVATYKISGGTFDLTPEEPNEKLQKLDETFSDLISSVSSHLLMVFILWIDHKLAENRITNEFSFDAHVPLYIPEWLKIIHGQTVTEPTMTSTNQNAEDVYNEFDQTLSLHHRKVMNSMSPSFKQKYYNVQPDAECVEDMPIQKLQVEVQDISPHNSRSLGLQPSADSVVISVKLLKPANRGLVLTKSEPMPIFVTVIESSSKTENPPPETEDILAPLDEQEYTCPHCFQKMRNMSALSGHLVENGIAFEWVKMGDQMSIIIAQESDDDDTSQKNKDGNQIKLENEVPLFQVATQTTFKLERYLFPPLKKFTPSASSRNAVDGRRIVSESVRNKLEHARSMRRFGKRSNRSLSSEDEEYPEDPSYGSVMNAGGEDDNTLQNSQTKAMNAVSRGTRSRPARNCRIELSSPEEEVEKEEVPVSTRPKRNTKPSAKLRRILEGSDSSVSEQLSSDSSEAEEPMAKRKRPTRGCVIKSAEVEETSYPCPYCEIVFDDPGILGEHLFDHVYPNKQKDGNGENTGGNPVESSAVDD